MYLQVWKWLMESKNEILSTDRQHLMSIVQKLVYEKDEKSFSLTVKNFKRTKHALKYPQFVKYVI